MRTNRAFLNTINRKKFTELYIFNHCILTKIRQSNIQIKQIIVQANNPFINIFCLTISDYTDLSLYFAIWKIIIWKRTRKKSLTLNMSTLTMVVFCQVLFILQKYILFNIHYLVSFIIFFGLFVIVYIPVYIS